MIIFITLSVTVFLIYQLSPGEGSVKTIAWEDKEWPHVKSKDLVNWQQLPIALKPTEWYEKEGCYSGSAIEKDGKMYLMYTGNIKRVLEDGSVYREEHQCLAVSDDGIDFEKLGPVIEFKELEALGYTSNVRDPNVFFDGQKYVMVLGAQRKNLTGTILLFHSPDLKKWTLQEEIVKGDWGYMCECPGMTHIDGQELVIFSAQGLGSKGITLNNLHVVGYMLNRDEKNYAEIDHGFDFYAPQLFKDEHGQTVLWGWLGSIRHENEVDLSPTINEGWLHCLTLPRVITLKNGKMYQLPHKNLEKLRKDRITLEKPNVDKLLDLNQYKMNGRTYELIIDIDELKNDFSLNILTNSRYYTELFFDFKRKLFSLNRDNSSNIATSKGARHCDLSDLKQVRVFVDNSCIEVYLNYGEAVFSADIFADETCTGLKLQSVGARIASINYYNI